MTRFIHNTLIVGSLIGMCTAFLFDWDIAGMALFVIASTAWFHKGAEE